MESVMNFLADNYIWFFVAAIILCFALIGFIIESKRKEKSEFKGESITEENTITNNVTDNTIPVTPVTPVDPVTNNLNSVNESVENSNEVNEMPINSETETKEQKIEYFSGPIEMPLNTPTPEPSPEMFNEAQVVSDNFNSPLNNENAETINTETTSDNITYEQTPNYQEQNVNISDTPVVDVIPPEDNEEQNNMNNNIFDNMN